MTVDIRQHIRDLSATGMQPAFIMSSIRRNFPRFYASMNQIYNERQSIRREEMDGRTPLQHCLYMATEHNYVVWRDLDSEDQLTRLLIANPTSIQMLRSWPHVVLIDTTYKTNKQKWPLCEIIGMTPTNHNFLVALCLMRDEAAVSYSWVLERLRDIYGTVQTPDIIVTDRDEGLSAAIHAVFPDVRHLLCVWHIGNDVENMVDKLCGGKKNQQGQLFRQTKWNPLVNSMTIADFENRWEGIVSTWSTRNRRVDDMQTHPDQETLPD
ncbi:protein FAR1-RELATED SEQUENCE 2-like [Amaranthus tricolor]|uniref:protein FAR1-RELATED SEQUENCE 2-like n=1 Tax=Amaranthus tricolor TaxID=29722 RepID=UPI0025898C3E|nr:protein FAR1-RELATED SEQUENCE 2-like [Amaranthus tricolor]